MTCLPLFILKTYSVLTSFFNIHSNMYINQHNDVVGINLSYMNRLQDSYISNSNNVHFVILNNQTYLPCFVPDYEIDPNGDNYYKFNSDMFTNYIIYDKNVFKNLNPNSVTN